MADDATTLLRERNILLSVLAKEVTNITRLQPTFISTHNEDSLSSTPYDHLIQNGQLDTISSDTQRVHSLTYRELKAEHASTWKRLHVKKENLVELKRTNKLIQEKYAKYMKKKTKSGQKEEKAAEPIPKVIS